ERPRISHRDEETVHAVPNDLVRAVRAIGGNDGCAARHRLHDDITKTFKPGAEDEEIGRRHRPERIVLETEKLDKVGDAQLGREPPQGLALGAFSEQSQLYREPLLELRDGSQQGAEVLLCGEAAT